MARWTWVAFAWALASAVTTGCAPTTGDLRSPDASAPADGDPTAGPTADGPGDPPGTTPGTEDDPVDPTDPGTTGAADCPPGVICVDALPYLGSATTTGLPSALDGYACAPGTDESGPEQVYRVTLAADGFLAAGLSGLPAGVDVDVHLLEVVDPLAADPDACIDRGHWDAAALLPAGTYWVVVDSWVDASGGVHDGDYTLSLAETLAGDYAADGLDAGVFDAALFAFDRAWQDGETDRLEYAVLDFSLPSTDPRLFVVDLREGELLFAELASHGIGSQDPTDLRYADRFSNVSGSNMSSLGMIRASETYYGDHGYSMRLDGLEPGTNDNVRDRVIVVHSADYATQDFVDDYGYLGRSQGCPAIDPAISDAVINTLTDGGLLFAFYPDPGWMADSPYLDGY